MSLDPEVERRLRDIAVPPQPAVPDSLYGHAVEVTRNRRGTMSYFGGRGRALVSAVGLAAAVILAVALAGVLLSARSNLGPGASGSPGSSLLPTPTSFEPSPTPRPTPTVQSWSTLKTPGSLTGWTGFSWQSGQKAGDNSIGRVMPWRGGYVATDTASNPGHKIWTSSDGETWTPVTALPPYWYDVAVAPGGLLVLVLDYGARSAPDQASPTPAPYSVSSWFSSDGIHWRNLGTPDLSGPVDSIAGTDAAIVATVGIWTEGGDSTTAVEFSTDGLRWTAETIGASLAWSIAPMVQSIGSRFFLMGGSTSPTGMSASPPPLVLVSTVQYSRIWWSDDGRTWTSAAGSVEGFGQDIFAGRDGLLMPTDSGSIPGGTGLAVSTDGGKTWQSDNNFGPLGQAPCSGECYIAADGVIGGNGTYFVAVKNGGKQAWLSTDGRAWTPIDWSGGDPSAASANGFGGFTVLPRGVLLTGIYGSAK